MNLKRGAMRSAMIFIVVACALKFLGDGVTLIISGYTLYLGHVDSMTYAAILTPVLGAHGWVVTRPTSQTQESDK